MNTHNQISINTEQLKKGMAELNELAQKEYHVDLDKVLTDPTRKQDERLLRVGRLVGVVLKKPFATAEPIDPTASVTGAYRRWELKDRAVFDESKKTWQYKVLEALRKEKGLPEEGLPTVYDLAYKLQNERGFFGYLLLSTRKYICGDPALRQTIDAEVKASQQSGHPMTIMTTGAAAPQIASLLAHHVSWLAVAAADPTGMAFLSGIVFLLLTVGIDTFCGWSEQFWPSPDTGAKEK